MSRIERTPTVSPPSTTTRCLKPPRTIASAARSSDQSGAAKVRLPERWSQTFSWSGLWPSESERRMSRSVMIPGPGCSGSMTTAAPTRRRTLFEEAVGIIEQEYASDLELDAVARRLATSRRQLQRAFAEAGQTSFRTYLAQVRMGRALELLREGSLPVREVASRVGYRQA